MTPTRRLLAALALMLSLPAARASEPFEGEATFKLVSRREGGRSLDGTARMFLGKAGYRVEWTMSAAGGTGSTGSGAGRAPGMTMTMLVMLPDSGKIYLVNDAARSYSVFDTKAAREGAKAPSATYTVQKLGSDRVAGYVCQNARVTSSAGTAFDVCVTKELGSGADWLAALDRGSADTGSWLAALRGQGIEGFPVRWAVWRKGEAEPAMLMELVAAEKKAVAPSLLQVPAGYKETAFAIGGLTPEQEKALGDARRNMTPEQRRRLEEMAKRRTPAAAP